MDLAGVDKNTIDSMNVEPYKDPTVFDNGKNEPEIKRHTQNY